MLVVLNIDSGAPDMSLTPSAMLPLTTPAPDFTLLDTASGQIKTLTQLKSQQATVIMFICNHCPYVKHVQAGLAALAHDYLPRGAAFIAISSNDAENYPEDSPAKMHALAAHAGFPFPYLYDETQAVARAYQAACTPDFFIFDGALRLAYRGQLDDSRPGNGRPVTGASMRAALDALFAGAAIDTAQVPSVGCNIKWKSA
jgi:peroxiredoxin